MVLMMERIMLVLMIKRITMVQMMVLMMKRTMNILIGNTNLAIAMTIINRSHITGRIKYVHFPNLVFFSYNKYVNKNIRFEHKYTVPFLCQT